VSTDPPAGDVEYASWLPEPYRGMAKKHMLAIFGDSLKDLLASRRATVRVLSDVDPRRRLGAFCLIAKHWSPDASEEELYRRAALADSDPEVRVEALRCWSHLYTGSRDAAFSRTLAHIVGHESEAPAFRSAAYLALCSVQLIEVPSHLEFLKSLVYDQDRLPKELDWEIVNRFLSA